MDKYEASVWRVPLATTLNASLVKKIQQGRRTAMILAGLDPGRVRAHAHGS